MSSDMSKKILVILGQPQRQSFGGAVAAAYAEGARSAPAEVRELFLGDLTFNPFGPVSADAPTELEPDLAAAQESIRWADHLVFVYPIWWGTIPALLKSFVERVFQQGFAMRIHADSPWWDKLLTGKSARLIVTMNTPPLIYRLVFHQPGHHTMKRSILGFCGVKPVRITEMGPLRNSSAARREHWLAKARDLGRHLA
jgi:NAD(P)H dehydrogenase (quinone)